MSGSVKIWVAGVSSSRPRLRRCRRRAPGSRRRDPSHPRQPECTCYFMTVPKRLLWVESDADRTDRPEDRAAAAGADVPDQLEPEGPHHAYPGAGRRRRGRRLGRVRQPVRPVLLPRDDRDLLAPAQGLPRVRWCSATTGRRSTSWWRSTGSSRGTGSPRRGWRWPAGMRSAAATGRPLAALLGGTRAEVAAGVSLGIEREIGALFDLIDQYLRRGIPPDQAQDRARARRRGRPAGPRAVSRPPAPGRRQLGLHARRRRTRSRRSTTSACS